MKPILQGNWFNIIHQELIFARKKMSGLIYRPKKNITQASLVIHHLDGHWNIVYFITFIKQVLQSKDKTFEHRG